MRASRLIRALGLALIASFAAPGAFAASGIAGAEIRGADVSSLPKAEAFGAVYRRPDGTPDDALKILRDHGVNTLRLRVWVTSPDGYHGATRILPIARRARALGFRLLIDFHYSDTWADPGHQTKPAAWTTQSLDELVASVHAHTFELCRALAAQGTPADFVQIGNEINDGLLWPEGRISVHGGDFGPLTRLLQAGIRAAREAHAGTRIALQLGTATDEKLIEWWFDGVRAAGLDWDLTALSYYPNLHGSPERLGTTLAAVAARYRRPVLVMETAYPFTLENADRKGNMIARRDQLLPDYDATPEGQASFLQAVFRAVRTVPAGRGAGVIYWEPTWTAVEGNGWNNRDPRSGNNWENQALFDFAGRALPGLDAFMEAEAPPQSANTAQSNSAGVGPDGLAAKRRRK